MWGLPFAFAGLLLAACDSEVEPPGETSATGTGVGAGSSSSTGSGAGGSIGATVASKVDVLLVVDNSRMMGSKQDVLAETLPDLVLRFVNPACVDPGGTPTETPGDPTAPCPAGSERFFAPVTDMHIGVISSSLGGHGADTCPDEAIDSACGGSSHTTNNDRGHLLSRGDPCTSDVLPTYQNLGFLAWDPNGVATPPGTDDPAELIGFNMELVRGAGAIGCGLEAPLEAMYRFLADPAPYASLSVDENNQLQKVGVDDVLLQQRAAFLRPDSALLIIVLSDEDDCSIREDGSFYLAAKAKTSGGGVYHLPPARAVCATDPNDACCASCGQATPDGCPEDPTCDDELTNLEDPVNLRCFDQKRRFGLDFLYPIQRYANALRQPTLGSSPDLSQDGDAVPNPIFSDLNNSGSVVRSNALVFMMGIVGVPWQLVARNPSDLAQGYKTVSEIDFDLITGDLFNNVPPSDPHMVESIDPRPGLPMTAGDPIHGGEYTTPERDDLQYACVFDLPDDAALDCTAEQACDCDQADNDKPICTGPSKQIQVKDKAYPGLRTLSVLHSIGEQGVVASICPATLEPNDAAYGYRQAVRALADAVRPVMAK